MWQCFLLLVKEDTCLARKPQYLMHSTDRHKKHNEKKIQKE